MYICGGAVKKEDVKTDIIRGQDTAANVGSCLGLVKDKASA